MRLIKIEEASAGMKIARGITDNVGNLLLPEGIVLTLEILDRLRARKVATLYVEGESAGAAGPDASVDLEQASAKIDAELDALFADVRQNPVMGAICSAAKTALKAKLR